MHSFSSSFYVWRQLVHREWLMFSRTLQTTLINNCIQGGFMTLLFGYLLPTLGMPSAYRIPVFLGTIVMINLGTGFSTCMMVANDIQTTKLIHYHLSLPVGPAIVMAAYVTGCMMRMIAVALPVGLFGLWGMGGFTEITPVPLVLMSMLLLAAAFFSLAFLLVSVWLPLNFILSSAWPRIFYPFFSLGAAVYTYEGVTAHVPFMRYVLRCNPVTYCSEGLRSGLLGAEGFLPAGQCIGAVSCACLILAFLLVRIAKKSLHVVTERKSV